MKRQLFLLLLSICIFAGCKQIVIWKYGIRSPKMETPGSITDYAKKQGQNPDNIWLFTDSVAFARFNKDSLFRKSYFGALVFNRQGLVINFKDTASCQWSVANSVRKLKRDSVYEIDTSRTCRGLMSSLVPLTGILIHPNDVEEYDYTVVYTWAKYIGKLNERLFEISEAARNNSSASIRVISLNVDMQKSWNLRKDQRIRMN
jgi:hypothetical protein